MSEHQEFGRRRAQLDRKVSKVTRSSVQSPIDEFLRGYNDEMRALRRAQFREMIDHLQAMTWSTFQAVFAFLLSLPAITVVLAVSVLAFAPSYVDRATIYALRLFPESSVTRRIDKNAKCARYDIYRDRNQALVGYLPTVNHCLERAYISLSVSDAALVEQTKALVLVEGPFDGPGVVLNMSAEGFARAAYYLFVPGSAGGSLPLQTAVEFAAGMPERLGVIDKLKFLFFWAPRYVAAHLPLVEDRKRFTIENLPCMAPMPGTGARMFVLAGGWCGLLVGPEATLDGLSLAQRCMIVASHKSQLRIVGPRGVRDDHAAMEQQFEALRARAEWTCVVRAATGVELGEARAELAAMAMPDPAYVLSRVNRFSDVARGVPTILRDARAATGGPIADDLALDVTRTAPLTDKLRADVVRVLADKLDPAFCWGERCPAARQMHVALGVGRLMPDGRLLLDAAYQSRSQSLIQRGRPTRNTASISKSMVLPLLLEHGISHVCLTPAAWNPRLPLPENLRDCAIGTLPMPLEAAISVSSNPAFLIALAEVPEEDLRGYLRLIGYHFDETLGRRDLIFGLVMGHSVAISPADLMRNIAFMSSGHPVTDLMVFDTPAEPTFTFGAFIGEEARKRAYELLQAPVAGPYGTLRGLNASLAAAGCLDLIGKSGTADAEDGRARDRLSVGAFSCDDTSDTRVFFSLFGAPSPDRGLGRAITSEMTTRIVGNALAAYATE